MFNFAFVTTIPSWINIKKKEVSVQKSLWTSTITSVVLYIIIGYSAAVAFKTEGTLNILSQLSSLNVLGRITTYVFSIAILMVSIPTFSIIVRNNLVQNKICGYKTATFLSHVLPWICVLPFQTGTFINDVINWSSLLFVSTANFIIPIIIYLKCLKFKSESKPRRYFTPRQREILKTIHWSSKTIQGFIDSYPVSKDQDQENIKYNKNNNINEKQENIDSDNNSSSSSETLNASNNDVPEIHLYTTNKEESKIVITEENAKQFLPPPPPVSRTASHSNVNNQYPISRFSTLPTHPLFISNYYKGIPSWVPFKPKTFALICLTIIMIIITAVIGLNVYQELDSHDILIYFSEDNSRANAIDALNENPLLVEKDKDNESSSKYNEDIYNSEEDKSKNRSKDNKIINANNTVTTTTTTKNNNSTKSINNNNYQAINNDNRVNNNNNNNNNKFNNDYNVYEPIIEFNYVNNNNENKYNSDAYKSNRKENNGGNESTRINQNGNERDDENIINTNYDIGRDNNFVNNNDIFYDNNYINNNNNNNNDNFSKDNIQDNYENNHDYNHDDNYNNHNNYDEDEDGDEDDEDEEY